jgi:hypothetical protein
VRPARAPDRTFVLDDRRCDVDGQARCDAADVDTGAFAIAVQDGSDLVVGYLELAADVDHAARSPDRDHILGEHECNDIGRVDRRQRELREVGDSIDDDNVEVVCKRGE